MEYTKGKWERIISGLTSMIVVATPEKQIQKKYIVAEHIYNKANANLIASAPDMYEALKNARAIIASMNPKEPETLRIVQEAINKAEGK